MWHGLRATRKYISGFIFIFVQLLGSTSAFSQFNFLTFWKHRAPTAAPFTWTGSGGNANWNNTANWSTGVVPGAGDTAHFVQSVCTPNCNATINTTINIGGLDLEAFYLGTITQGSNTVTVGSAGWSQVSGTFAGGSSNITVNGNLTLSGGTFTSTSATLTVASNFTASGSPTFNHNSGTVNFAPATPATAIQTGTITFNNLNFTASGQTYNLTGSAMTAVGTLTIGDTSSAGSFMNGGTISAQANINFSNYGYSGSTTIIAAGSTSQTVTGVATASIPNFQIASTGGTVTLSGTLVFTGNYTYTSGTVSAYAFAGSSANAIAQGPALYYKLDETSGTAITDSSGNGAGGTLSGSYALGQPGEEGNEIQFGSSGMVMLNSTLALGSNSTITAWVKTPLPSNGNWKTVTRGTSDHQIIFNASTNEFGSYQNYNSSGFHGSGVLANNLSAGWHHFAVVQTGGNTLFYVDGSYVSTTSGQPTDSIVVVGNYQGGGQGVPDLDDVAIFTRALSAAEINIEANPPAAASSNLVFQNSSGTPTITPGNSVNYGSVSFTGANSNYTLSGTFNVGLNLVIGDSGSAHRTMNSGTIVVKGNVTSQNYGYEGSTLIQTAGGSQTISGVVGAGIPPLTIASSGTVTLSGTLNLTGNFIYTSGTISAGSSTLLFSHPASAYTITPGSGNYNNVSFANTNSSAVATMTGTMNVGGNLSFASTGSAGVVNGGNFSVTGNVSYNNFGESGNSTLTFVGSGSTTLSIGASSSILSGNITVNKTGSGAVALSTAANFNSSGQNMTVTAGTVNMSGFNMNVNSTLTVASLGSVYCSGGTLTEGTLSNSGAIDCAGTGFSWTGLAGDHNWNTAGNWSGGAIPGASNTAIFGSQCSGAACNATINANISVNGIKLTNAYTGTLTQGSGNTMTLASYGWWQDGGTFTGSNASITTQTLTLTGGTLTSTTGTLQLYGGLCATTTLFNQTGGTFSHNNGTIKFTGGSGGYCSSYFTIAASSAINFYHLQFDNYQQYSGNGSYYSSTQPLNVAGNLTIGATQGQTVLNSSTINLTGNLIGLSGAAGGSATINIIGNGAQKYTGSTSIILPQVLVNTTGSFSANTSVTDVSFSQLTIQQGTFTAPTGNLQLYGGLCATTTLFNQTGGTFSHNNGTTKFTGGSNGYCTSNFTIAGASAINFYHLQFDNYFQYSGNGSSYISTQPLNVAGNLTIGASGGGGTQLNSSTINLSGNLIGLSGANGGSATINIIGNGAQTYSGSTTSIMPQLVVNTTGSFSASTSPMDVSFTQLTIQQGTFTAPTGTLQLYGGQCVTTTLFNQTGGTFSHNNGTTKFTGASNYYCSSSFTIAAASAINFYSLQFDNYYGGLGSNYSSTQTWNVAGNLTIGATQGQTFVNSAPINLTGNLIGLSGAAGGSATINIIGNSAQKYSGSTSSILPQVVVNTTGSFSANTSVTDVSFSQLAIQQGAFTAPTGTLAIQGGQCVTATLFNQTGGTFSHNNGTTKFTGSSYDSSCVNSFTITASAAINFYHLQFDHYYAHYAGGSIYSSNRTLNVAGNLTIGSSVNGFTQVNSSTINLSGNLISPSGAGGGTAIINVVGNGAQTYSGVAGTTVPSVVVNTTGTFAPASGTTDIGMSTLAVSQGTFTAPTGTLTIYPPLNSTVTALGVTGGSFVHNNGTVLFYGYTEQYTSGGSNSSTCSFTITGSSTINFYNLSFSSGTHYAANTYFYLGQNTNVANAINVSASTSVPHMSGHNLTAISLALAGDTLYRDGGVLTVNGSSVGPGSYGSGTIGN